MITFPDRQSSCYFDVDNTLVEWVHENFVDVHPDKDSVIFLSKDGWAQIPIKEHTEYLKQLKLKGDVVVVWSQRGASWAETVVKALGLEQYVDVCLTKPNRIIDDLDSGYWMPEREFYGRKDLEG